MHRLFASIAAFAAVSAVVVTAALGQHLPTTGAPIRLLNPAQTPATYPADTPFFVRHGWTCTREERADCLDPTSESRLYVDGQLMYRALDLHTSVTCPPEVQPPSDECLSRGFLTNFRHGLPTGAHAFRGEWWFAGEAAIVREATIQFVG